ncbi:hypothetical protein KCP74_15725 [Salmonella enterica subsp. enterica]|nr:hypothetical protein KCP74_15725 [Salmonella enterica subsp. enterica]
MTVNLRQNHDLSRPALNRCVTSSAKRQSDAQPLHHRHALFSGFRRSFPNRHAFWGRCPAEEEKDRYRGADTPVPFTQAATAAAYSLETPYLNKLPLRHKGIVLAQPGNAAPGTVCLCSQNHRRSV